MIKKICNVSEGHLFYTTEGKRKPLADFSGEVQIHEEQELVSILGCIHKGTKKLYARILLCNDIKYKTDTNIYDYMCFDALGTVNDRPVVFSGLTLVDSDPENNTLSFEINDKALIEKILKCY